MTDSLIAFGRNRNVSRCMGNVSGHIANVMGRNRIAEHHIGIADRRNQIVRDGTLGDSTARYGSRTPRSLILRPFNSIASFVEATAPTDFSLVLPE